MKNYLLLSRPELLKILNDDETSYSERLVISIVLVYKTSSWFKLKDESILISASLEVFYLSLKKKVTLDKIYKVLSGEVNLISNIFIHENIQLVVDIELLTSSNSNIFPDKKILLDLFREKILELCPEKYKLVIITLLESGELLYDNYSYYDKIFINSFLISIGYTLGNDISIPNLSKLDTFQKKALFIFFLNKKCPELFIYLISMKSLSNVFLFLESMSDNGNIISIIDSIDIIESCIKTTLDCSKLNIDKENIELFLKITNDIILNEKITLDYTDLLKKSLSFLEESYEKEIGLELKRYSGNQKQLNIISNKLKDEISDQINIVNLMNKI